MKKFVFYVMVGWVLAMVLFGCAGSRGIGADQARAIPSMPVLDTDSITIQPASSFFDRLLGIHRDAQTYDGATAVYTGKKATVNVYNAPATVTTTTAGKKAQVAAGDKAAVLNAGKKAGPQIQADSGAHVATSGQNIAQAGNGNVASMPLPVPKLTLGQRLAAIWRTARWPLVVLGGLAGAAALIAWLAPASGLGLFILGVVRRRSTT